MKPTVDTLYIEIRRVVGGWTWIERLVHDLRYAFRMLRRSPGFTFVAVLSLALAIGANTAIFSVIDALMLKRLPIRDPERLLALRYDPARTPGLTTHYLFDYPTFERFRDYTDVFSAVSAIVLTDRCNVTVDGDIDPGQVQVCLASGNYFSNLGVGAAIGRTFTPDDDRVPPGHPVVVVSDDYWQRRFARASDVVGRTLSLNGTAYTVLGVTPRNFTGDWVGRPADLWIPIMMQSQVMLESPGLLKPTRFGTWLRIVARLKPDVTISQAEAAGQSIFQQLWRERVGPDAPPQEIQRIDALRISLEPAATGFSPQRWSYAQPLAILTTLVGLVLLVACANVANLLLARSAARRKEMAVRLAIGAGRARIVSQLLAESLVLAMMGGALGLVFAVWGTGRLMNVLGSAPVKLTFDIAPDPIRLDLHPDWRMLGFATALCLFTGILFGLAPAVRGSKVSLSTALAGRGTSCDSAGGGLGPARALVILQVALSLLLLIGAGLLVRTLRNLKSQDLGFDREHLLLAWATPAQLGRWGRAIPPLFHTVQERISSLPGVLSASPAEFGLLTGHDIGNDLIVQGFTPKPGEEPRSLSDFVVPGFFETVGMRLLRGRDFTERDDTTAPKVAIVNESMARFYFGNDDPIGKRFGRGPREANCPLEIVGVVSNARYASPREKSMMTFFPYRQDPGHMFGSMCVAVRAAGNPSTIAASVRQELRNIDPNLPVLRIDTIEEQLNYILVQERLIATVSGVIGAVAALLACIGLYGVISYRTSRRTSEIGIRMALGATKTGVLWMVLREGLLLVLIGIAIGVPGALVSTHLISNRLFDLSATDPLTIAAASFLLMAVAGFAGYLPARRAARIDPMAALRYD